MSWEGGVDLAAMTVAGLATPNVIIHVARMVHTPVGSAPSGMICWQPDPDGAPTIFGFISGDPAVVGSYFGPAIFAGTPFEQAPSLSAAIEVNTIAAPDQVSATVSLPDFTFTATLKDLRPSELLNRPPTTATPFWQQGVESSAGSVTLTVNGEEVPLFLPPRGLAGGAPAVSAPCGIYAR
jgi:hypothetical protein